MTSRMTLLLGALAASLSCSSSSPSKTGAGGTTGQATLDAGVDIVSGSFAADANPFASPPADAAHAPPEGWTAAAPPEVSCDPNADVSTACDLPPSTCAYPSDCDAGGVLCGGYSPWIVYYEHPRCVAGRCVWDQSFFACDVASSCRAGACIVSLGTS